MKASDKPAKGSNGFMTLKVALPPTGIVRTISVPECMTLEDLHEAIQAVMGWGHEHLWHFAESLCPHMAYRVDGDRIVDAEAFACEREDSDRAVDETLHAQCLNGNTVLDLRVREAARSSAPKISRNAPCPCGSGKKYKLRCGKGMA